jgi:hypothetical protein
VTSQNIEVLPHIPRSAGSGTREQAGGNKDQFKPYHLKTIIPLLLELPTQSYSFAALKSFR